jgi:predicted RNase H-like HicB family nuclease
MKPIDLTNVLRDHEGKWVILAEDNSKVLFSGNTLEEIEAHLTEGVVLKVGSFEPTFSPTNFD